MVDARLIESRADRPIKYYADQTRWSTLLDLAAAPPWHPWATVFAFVLRLQEWLRRSGIDSASVTLAASLAREFMLEHGKVLTDLKLDVPDDRDYLGEATPRPGLTGPSSYS